MGYEQTIKDAQAASQSEQTQEQSQEGTQTGQEQAQSGGASTPDFELGVDFSDIPETIRPQVKEKFKAKGKLLEDGYQGKYREVAKFKQAQEELHRLGLTADEARDVLLKHIEQRQNPAKATEQKQEAFKTLDRLIKDAPHEQRSSLEQMRQIILEETEVSTLRDEVKQLQNLVGMLSGRHREDRRSTVTAELNKFSETYGKELVDKYKDAVIDVALKYPQESIRRIFFHEAADELEQAILSKNQKGEPLTQEKRNAISSAGSGVSGSTAAIDSEKESFSSLITKITKLGK